VVVGLPTSSSHALIGGYAGAAVMRSGWHVIVAEGWYKTLILFWWRQSWDRSGTGVYGCRLFGCCAIKPRRIDAWFRKMQLISAAAYSLATEAMMRRKLWNRGERSVWSALFELDGLGRQLGKFHWPIILAAHASIAPGNLLRWLADCSTMGSRITKLKAGGRILREAAGAITLFSTALPEFP